MNWTNAQPLVASLLLVVMPVLLTPSSWPPGCYQTWASRTHPNLLRHLASLMRPVWELAWTSCELVHSVSELVPEKPSSCASPFSFVVFCFFGALGPIKSMT